MTYSIDLKRSVVQYCSKNKTTVRQVSQIFGIGKSSVGNWINGATYKPRDKRRKKMDAITTYIHNLMTTTPMIGIREIKIKLASELNVHMCRNTVWRALKTLGYSSKKVRTMITTAKNTPEIKKTFAASMREKPIDSLFSLDETCFQLETHRRNGWSKRGKRCIYKTRRTGWTNITGEFLISTKGIVSWKLYKKSITGVSFVSFLDDLDKDYMKGKMILMDNFSVHHMKTVKTLLKSMETEPIYVPPYSPDLNPIEEMFSCLKIRVREKIISTETELRKELTHLVNEINEKGLLMYYNHAYYES
jgi:transposase